MSLVSVRGTELPFGLGEGLQKPLTLEATHRCLVCTNTHDKSTHVFAQFQTSPLAPDRQLTIPRDLSCLSL